MSFNLRDFREIQCDVARRFRELRVIRRFTRQTLAQHAGVSAASLKRFEVTGNISLASLVKLAYALDAIEGLDQLFPKPIAKSLDEIEAFEKINRKSRFRRGRK